MIVPVRAVIVLLPTIGVKATDQQTASTATVSVGNPVVVGTAFTSFWAGRPHIPKPKLRSEDMLLALLPMPVGVVCFPKRIVRTLERVLNGTHRLKEGLEEGIILDYPHGRKIRSLESLSKSCASSSDRLSKTGYWNLRAEREYATAVKFQNLFMCLSLGLIYS